MAEDTALNPDYLIADEAELAALFPATHQLAIDKCMPALDAHSRAFIARAPFLCISTQSPDGLADVSPRGDPAGFVRVLDDHTLLIPDRPGNNRLDTQRNILANPAVGLIFMVPGFDETLRVNGTARLTRDPALLATMEVQGRRPTTAIAVTVHEAFLHCAKAFRRSRLWDPATLQDRKAFPSLRAMIHDQTTGRPADPAELEKLDADLEEAYRRSMY
ncbi:pyridoxamine 5'-phosphate oxidase family protein [Oceanicola sp. D3]|uniref:pyridoxamine 5'-phosphate oxidase family protein n=1 Tax=Oceanicola sp. D3 TaxID=2587163 RepID=UPI00112219D0|nr:pyridoxamine 5'-phosphate oxidase family protein [Oceanicola sp. D3]QDC10558.1 pyridoxamine 5'-phosphate oxidase family protein [Oceanicola sp. D3]